MATPKPKNIFLILYLSLLILGSFIVTASVATNPEDQIIVLKKNNIPINGWLEFEINPNNNSISNKLEIKKIDGTIIFQKNLICNINQLTNPLINLTYCNLPIKEKIKLSSNFLTGEYFISLKDIHNNTFEKIFIISNYSNPKIYLNKKRIKKGEILNIEMRDVGINGVSNSIEILDSNLNTIQNLINHCENSTNTNFCYHNYNLSLNITEDFNTGKYYLHSYFLKPIDIATDKNINILTSFNVIPTEINNSNTNNNYNNQFNNNNQNPENNYIVECYNSVCSGHNNQIKMKNECGRSVNATCEGDWIVYLTRNYFDGNCPSGWKNISIHEVPGNCNNKNINEEKQSSLLLSKTKYYLNENLSFRIEPGFNNQGFNSTITIYNSQNKIIKEKTLCSSSRCFNQINNYINLDNKTFTTGKYFIKIFDYNGQLNINNGKTITKSFEILPPPMSTPKTNQANTNNNQQNNKFTTLEISKKIEDDEPLRINITLGNKTRGISKIATILDNSSNHNILNFNLCSGISSNCFNNILLQKPLNLKPGKYKLRIIDYSRDVVGIVIEKSFEIIPKFIEPNYTNSESIEIIQNGIFENSSFDLEINKGNYKALSKTIYLIKNDDDGSETIINIENCDNKTFSGGNEYCLNQNYHKRIKLNSSIIPGDYKLVLKFQEQTRDPSDLGVQKIIYKNLKVKKKINTKINNEFNEAICNNSVCDNPEPTNEEITLINGCGAEITGKCSSSWYANTENTSMIYDCDDGWSNLILKTSGKCQNVILAPRITKSIFDIINPQIKDSSEKLRVKITIPKSYKGFDHGIEILNSANKWINLKCSGIICTKNFEGEIALPSDLDEGIYALRLVLYPNSNYIPFEMIKTITKEFEIKKEVTPQTITPSGDNLCNAVCCNCNSNSEDQDTEVIPGSTSPTPDIPSTTQIISPINSTTNLDSDIVYCINAECSGFNNKVYLENDCGKSITATCKGNWWVNVEGKDWDSNCDGGWDFKQEDYIEGDCENYIPKVVSNPESHIEMLSSEILTPGDTLKLKFVKSEKDKGFYYKIRFYNDFKVSYIGEEQICPASGCGNYCEKEEIIKYEFKIPTYWQTGKYWVTALTVPVDPKVVGGSKNYRVDFEVINNLFQDLNNNEVSNLIYLSKNKIKLGDEITLSARLNDYSWFNPHFWICDANKKSLNSLSLKIAGDAIDGSSNCHSYEDKERTLIFDANLPIGKYYFKVDYYDSGGNAYPQYVPFEIIN